MAIEPQHLAFMIVGMLIGLLIGYQVNTEKTASSQAYAMCNTTQSNLNTMISNFNAIARNCSAARDFVISGAVDSYGNYHGDPRINFSYYNNGGD